MKDIKSKTTAVLAVAGSDPSGGAGIQADLKTFVSLGVYGGAVITCLTVQNTTGVYSYQPIDSDLVKKQIEFVLEDMEVSHIKIGMIGSNDIANGIGKALAHFSGEVIYDPVLRASSGQLLVDPTAIDKVSPAVIESSTVLTPNLPELIKLTGIAVESLEDIKKAALWLFSNHKKLRSIILKGGHGDLRNDRINDYLITREKNEIEGCIAIKNIFSEYHPRIKTDNDHGTGCTFASAFTAYHKIYGNDEQAFKKAVSYMVDILSASKSIKIGSGRGPLMHHFVKRRTK